jgi:hypothetical protein
MKYDDLDKKPRICPECFGEVGKCSCSPYKIIKETTYSNLKSNKEFKFICRNCGGEHLTSLCTTNREEITQLPQRFTPDSKIEYCTNCNMFGHPASQCFQEKSTYEVSAFSLIRSGLLENNRQINPYSFEPIKTPVVTPCAFLSDKSTCTFGTPGEEPKPSKAYDLPPLQLNPTKRTITLLLYDIPAFPKLNGTRACLASILPYEQTQCSQYRPNEENK